MNIFFSISTAMISGLILGSLYVIMSIGLSLIWGTIRVFNWTHGSLIMLGAFIVWYVNSVGGLLFGIIIGMVILFIIGMMIEKILVEPFYASPKATFTTLITTLAGMLLIENLAQIIWGVRLKQLPVLAKGTVRFLGSCISFHELFIVMLSPIVCILFYIFLKKSKIGMAIRAVEQNLDFALLVGMNVKNIYMITFGISSALACIAGVFLGSIRFISPSMGQGYLLKAFVIVILGGLGSIRGTLLAAYLVGIIEAFVSYYLGLYWTPVVLFSILIITLIYKPMGILGGKE